MTTFSTAKTGCVGTTIRWFNPMTLRLIGCTVLILTLPCFGQSSMERRLWALKQLENGSNSHCGPSGELGETQIMPYRLRECKIPIPAKIDAKWVSDTSETIIARSCAHFERLHHRKPTDYETYLLWSRPATLLTRNRPVTAKEAQRAQFYSNLCQKPLATANNLSQQ